MSKRPSTSTAASAAKSQKLAPIFGGPSVLPFKSNKLGKHESCWHGVWGEPHPSTKILALDLDGTVITTASGNKWPASETDWKWWDPKVPTKIRQAHADGYAIIFTSNQAGKPSSQLKFQRKGPLIGAKLNVPFHCFAAHGYDEYRKPGTGMWDVYVEKYNGGVEVNVAESIYVGDAAGRPRKGNRSEDHSDVDRKMGLNLGVRFFTPEEYFRDEPIDNDWKLKGWNPTSHDHTLPLFTPTHLPLVPRPASEFETLKPEVVIFVGSPASGKTSFFEKHFAPADYIHVNQDTLKTRTKCLDLVRASLAVKKSVVVDNTSPSVSVRKEYLSLVRSEFPTSPIRILHFTAHRDLCVHNSFFRASAKDAARDALPQIAFNSYATNLEVPKDSEGFDAIQRINFRFEGTPEERARWERWHDCFSIPKPKKK